MLDRQYPATPSALSGHWRDPCFNENWKRSKTPITAADLLNDRGREFCGREDAQDVQLFLSINDINRTKTKMKSPQTNGTRARLHKTALQEFCQVAFHKKRHDSIDARQPNLDTRLHHYNHKHQGKICCGHTPFETMIDGKESWREKFGT